jgi:hypothetical protein
LLIPIVGNKYMFFHSVPAGINGLFDINLKRNSGSLSTDNVCCISKRSL